MTVPLPALRQIVLLAGDLNSALTDVRTFLGLSPGIRAEADMAALGFEHEVLAISQTFVEVVSPLTAASSGGRLLARHGEAGYMVAVQVSDLAAVVARGARLGLTPILQDVVDGNPITQWHPRDLGTLAEIDEIAAGHDWHFCPELSDTGATGTVSDLVSVDIAVADPAACAQRWAALLGLPPPSGARLDLARGSIHFVAADGRRALAAADFTTGTDPDAPSTGATTVCGVRLRIRAASARGDTGAPTTRTGTP